MTDSETPNLDYVRNLGTTWTDVTDLNIGDCIWMQRKVRGSLGRDIVAVIVSDVTIEGDQAFFDHVDADPKPHSGRWSACTSATAKFERVDFPD